jgi:hypothetical protein
MTQASASTRIGLDAALRPHHRREERSIMRTTYEVRSGRRPLATRQAWSAHDAVFDYVRSLGCPQDEVVCLGAGAVSWRGAVYRAEPVADEAVERPQLVGTR